MCIKLFFVYVLTFRTIYCTQQSLSNWSWRTTKMFTRLIFAFCILLIINSAGASYRWSRNIFFPLKLLSYFQQIQKLITKLKDYKSKIIFSNCTVEFKIQLFSISELDWFLPTSTSTKFRYHLLRSLTVKKYVLHLTIIDLFFSYHRTTL